MLGHCSSRGDYNNPLDSVSKLIVVVTRCKSNDTAEWCIEMLLDFAKSGLLTTEQCGCRALEGSQGDDPATPLDRAGPRRRCPIRWVSQWPPLSGKLVGQQGKGILDIFLFKKGVLAFLINTTMGKMSWNDKAKATIREVTGSIAKFREKCGYINAMPEDLSWRAALPKSAQNFLALLEHLIFGFRYDSTLRTALVNRRDFASVVSSDTIGEELDGIEEMASDESGKPKTEEAAAETVDDDVPVLDAIASLETTADIKKLEAKVTDDTEAQEKIGAFRTQARRLIQTYVCFGVETDTDDTIIKLMTECGAGRLPKDTEQLKGWVGVRYDVKNSGEASAQPQLRIPPMRDSGDHIKRLCSLKLRASGDETVLPEHEMWFVPDGGVNGNKARLLAGLSQCEKQVREVNIWFDQASCEKRLERVKGFIPLNQAEKCYIMTQKTPTNPADIKRKNFTGLAAVNLHAVGTKLTKLHCSSARVWAGRLVVFHIRKFARKRGGASGAAGLRLGFRVEAPGQAQERGLRQGRRQDSGGWPPQHPWRVGRGVEEVEWADQGRHPDCAAASLLPRVAALAPRGARALLPASCHLRPLQRRPRHADDVHSQRDPILRIDADRVP